MAATPVAAPQVTSPAATQNGVIPDRIVSALTDAGFPAEAGNPLDLVRETRLPRGKTVSHLLTEARLNPYSTGGNNLLAITEAMNRESNPNFSFNSMRGEFMFVDATKLAAMPRALRAQVEAAFGRAAASLRGEAAPAAPPTVDKVEPPAPTTRTAPPKSPQLAPPNEGKPAVPAPQQAAPSTTRSIAAPAAPAAPPREAPPTTPQPDAVTGPAPAGATTPGAALPPHPILDRTTSGYRGWIAQGNNRSVVVENLLGHAQPDFAKGLDEVQTRYALGQPGRPTNIEDLTKGLQRDLTRRPEEGGPAKPAAPNGRMDEATVELLDATRHAATQAKAEDIERVLKDRPNLRGALNRGAPAGSTTAASPVAAAPTTPPVNAATVDPADKAPTSADPAPAAAPSSSQTNPAVPATQKPSAAIADLEKARASHANDFTTRRDALLQTAKDDPNAALRLVSDAAGVSPELASDLANAWISDNKPWLFGSNTNDRDLARLVAREPAVLNTLSPEVAATMRGAIAGRMPSPGNEPFGYKADIADVAALNAFDTAALNRAKTPRDLTDTTSTLRFMTQSADPALVASTIERLAANGGSATIGAALGSDIVNYVYGQRGSRLTERTKRVREVMAALRARGLDKPVADAVNGSWWIGRPLTTHLTTP